jgi:uncharacterized membrane protein
MHDDDRTHFDSVDESDGDIGGPAAEDESSAAGRCPPEGEAEALEGEDLEDRDDDVTLDNILLPELRQVALHVVEELKVWSGPLPPALELGEYDRQVPGTADLIVDDFKRRSLAATATLDADLRLSEREYDFKQQEQRLREDNARDDRLTRRNVQRFGVVVIPMIILLGFIVIMWGPFEDDWATVAAGGLFLSPVVILAAIVLVRGRMTSQESDVLTHTLPHLANRRQQDREPDPVESPTTPGKGPRSEHLT